MPKLDELDAREDTCLVASGIQVHIWAALNTISNDDETSVEDGEASQTLVTGTAFEFIGVCGDLTQSS